jgi:L-ribulose-5-phosphate 3-epimerase
VSTRARRVPPLTLGVMQGRLSPQVGAYIQAFPWETWEQEFAAAPQAGVKLIEWIVDADRFTENPLLTDRGRTRMRELEHETGTLVRTVCADCFMAWPLTTQNETERRDRLAALSQIIGAAAAFGVHTVTLPFVDASAINTAADRQAVVTAMTVAVPEAEKAGVRLALETSLPPAEFRSLVDALAPLPIGVNYDSGNSASLGYDVRQEFEAYGSFVAVVHIKDRMLGGGTVPLGEGHADFPAFFGGLRAMDYSGPLILQAARRGDEVETIRTYVRFVQAQLGASVERMEA